MLLRGSPGRQVFPALRQSPWRRRRACQEPSPKQCDGHKNVAAVDMESGNFLRVLSGDTSGTADCGQQSTASICRTISAVAPHSESPAGGDEMPLQRGMEVPSASRLAVSGIDRSRLKHWKGAGGR